MQDEKGKRWQKVKQWAERATDAVGRPIEPGIMDTVILLNLLGITTTSSCEGHLDSELTPNIIFCDANAMELEAQLMEIQDELDPEFGRLLKECIRLNFSQTQLMNPFLNEFYQSRLVPFTQRLILAPMMTGGGLLLCQGVGKRPGMNVVDLQERRRILAANQSEMRAFTSFLSQKYFLDDKDGAPQVTGAPSPSVTG